MDWFLYDWGLRHEKVIVYLRYIFASSFFVSIKVSFYETMKYVFYFTSIALFVLEKI